MMTKKNSKHGPLVINLLAGPGAGKSTGAAYIFSRLKMCGVNAELVTEFAKDKVWERNEKALKNQAYLFGQQYYRINRLEGEVDCVITDSPLILGLIYNKDPNLGEPFNDVIRHVAASYDSLYYFIKRMKPYNPKGRIHNESQSDAINIKIKQLLEDEGIKYKQIDGLTTGYEEVVADVLAYLRRDRTEV